jgi:hypothetical protein
MALVGHARVSTEEQATTVQPFLAVRTAVLNDTPTDAFRHSGFRPANDDQRLTAATPRSPHALACSRDATEYRPAGASLIRVNDLALPIVEGCCRATS